MNQTSRVRRERLGISTGDIELAGLLEDHAPKLEKMVLLGFLTVGLSDEDGHALIDILNNPNSTDEEINAFIASITAPIIAAE